VSRLRTSAVARPTNEAPPYVGGILAAMKDLQSTPITTVIDTFSVSSGEIIPATEDFTVEFAPGKWLGFSTATGRACLVTSFPNSTGDTGSPCLNFSVANEGGLGVMDQSFSAADITATPIPAALPLFATGLGGLGLIGWRRKRKAA
jgi:hypothetical protein